MHRQLADQISAADAAIADYASAVVVAVAVAVAAAY